MGSLDSFSGTLETRREREEKLRIIKNALQEKNLPPELKGYIVKIIHEAREDLQQQGHEYPLPLDIFKHIRKKFRQVGTETMDMEIENVLLRVLLENEGNSEFSFYELNKLRKRFRKRVMNIVLSALSAVVLAGYVMLNKSAEYLHTVVSQICKEERNRFQEFLKVLERQYPEIDFSSTQERSNQFRICSQRDNTVE